MSVTSVKNYLKPWGLDERVREFDVSSATVAEAALAVQCEENRIAKTMGFLVDGAAVLIVAVPSSASSVASYPTSPLGMPETIPANVATTPIAPPTTAMEMLPLVRNTSNACLNQ